MSQIISILNQKGGVGKTTTTISLAVYLSKLGKTVLIVDADPQGNATSGLGLEKRDIAKTTYSVLSNDSNITEAILETKFKDVYILPANADLAAIEIDISDAPDKFIRMRSAIKSVEFDFVLIDCPPSLGLLTISSLVASDWLLIPVQTEFYAMEGLGQLLEVFQRVKKSINPDLAIIGILLTMFDSRTSLSGQVKDQLGIHFDALLFDTIIPRNVKLAEAPSFGLPISEYDKWSKGARAYKQLSKEVIKRVSKR